MTIMPPPASQDADLVVGSAAVSDASPTTGAAFTLSATVTNEGDGAAAATTLRFYRSEDATVTAADTPVGTAAVEALAASATAVASIELTAPPAAGRYYYGACVEEVPGESGTADNCSRAVVVTVQPPPRYADLVVGPPEVSDASPTTGAPFTLTATVTNEGDGAAAATTLRFYRSEDATVTAADTPVGTVPVEALAASATTEASIALTAPSTAGRYYYGACVEEVPGESGTADNCSVSSVEVTVTEPPPPTPPTTPPPQPPPQHSDLVVGSPSVNDASPTTGAAFTLTATVTNEGDGAAAATTLRFYRSEDATVTAADTPVGTAAVEALAASAAAVASIELTAPPAAGRYYYGACVEPVPGESDTADNCSVSSVEVTVTEPPPPTPPPPTPPPPTPPTTPPPSQGAPDLVVSLAVDDASPAPGGQITLSATVRNTGTGKAAETRLVLYRASATPPPSASLSNLAELVGAGEVEALAASGTSSRRLSLAAPATAGPYVYIACVDKVPSESDTDNNCSHIRVDVSDP